MIERFERPGFVRLTASDRPGVAQPVPERDIPPQPWGKILLGALVLFLLLMTAWECHWRAFGATPGYRNSDGAWAEQRRRINNGEGDKTVLIGSSRMLFDVQLPDWERVTGERPIQLALEGTSPLPMLEDLAADPDFTGRLVMDTTPTSLFLGMSGRRASVVPYYHEQSPSQRSGHWLSRRFLEPWFAFYDPDFALPVVVRRQAWPNRPGLPPRILVRKLSVQEIDRNTRMWRQDRKRSRIPGADAPRLAGAAGAAAAADGEHRSEAREVARGDDRTHRRRGGQAARTRRTDRVRAPAQQRTLGRA